MALDEGNSSCLIHQNRIAIVDGLASDGQEAERSSAPTAAVPMAPERNPSRAASPPLPNGKAGVDRQDIRILKSPREGATMEPGSLCIRAVR